MRPSSGSLGLWSLGDRSTGNEQNVPKVQRLGEMAVNSALGRGAGREEGEGKEEEGDEKGEGQRAESKQLLLV